MIWIVLTPETEHRLHQLVKIFLEENAKVNLSAFRTEESCWIGNVLDSLAATEFLQSLHAVSVLDLGTGGGFPLLPLAMALPDMRFAGLDSTQKKIDAIGRIATAMDIKNVDLICGRAETLGRARRYRETFDAVTVRAVAEITVLLEYCSPLVKPGGSIILWKSMNAGDELTASEKAQQEVRCALKKSVIYDLPGDFGKRQLLIFGKTGKLSDTYPRDVGVPKKNPL